MNDIQRPRCWPAYAVAVLFLCYAIGKAVFAVEARLGFPGGPLVSEEETAGYFLDAATGQWLAAASGVVGAVIAVATVTAVGRMVPRPVMVLVLVGMLLAVVGGGGIMIEDGFVGIGVGWQWYFGIVGPVAIVLCLEMIRSYLRGPRVQKTRQLRKGPIG